MARRNCKHPGACVAGSRGPCRKCSDMSAHAERMRKLHADPEFAAAHAERMRKLHADPEFAAAHAERMRKLHADPEFAAKLKAAKAGVPDVKIPAWVPVDLHDDYFSAARNGGEEHAASVCRRLKREMEVSE